MEKKTEYLTVLSGELFFCIIYHELFKYVRMKFMGFHITVYRVADAAPSGTHFLNVSKFLIP